MRLHARLGLLAALVLWAPGPAARGASLGTPAPGGIGEGCSGQARPRPVGAGIGPATTRWVADVEGAEAARLIALKAVAESQIAVQGPRAPLRTTSPGQAYPYVFLRDLVYAADAFPAFYSKEYLEPALERFAQTIGADPVSPDSPAEHIGVNGEVFHRPGATLPGSGHLAALDSGPFFVLLGAQIYERGNTAIFTRYRGLFERALRAAPRDEAGRIYSDPRSPSQGWGFEDGVPSANKGGLGVVTAYHAVAYRKLASMAAAEGDLETASASHAAGECFVTALASLRGSDGFYRPSTQEAAPGAVLTAMVVFFELAPEVDLAGSAAALLAAYREASPFSGGEGSHGGRIAQRGGVRHLVYPHFYSESNVQAPPYYQDGGAWLGPWVGWLAHSMARVDPASGKELLQDAVDEVLREHRVSGAAPWEWSYRAGNGSRSSPAAAGFLGFVGDLPIEDAVTLDGARGASQQLDLPRGWSNGTLRVAGSTGEATVTLEAAVLKSSVHDPIPSRREYAAFGLLGSIDLPVRASAPAIDAGALAHGGRLRASISRGASSAPVKVVGARTEAVIVPAPAHPAMTVDDFRVSRLATDYLVHGNFKVAGGVLTASSAEGGDLALFTASGEVADGIYAVRTQGNARVITGAVIRASGTKRDRGIAVYVWPASEHVAALDVVCWDSGDSRSVNITGKVLPDVPFDLTIVAHASQIEVLVNGEALVRMAGGEGFHGGVTSAEPGYFGVYSRTPNRHEVRWSDLRYTPFEDARRVPPGHTLSVAALDVVGLVGRGYAAGEVPRRIGVRSEARLLNDRGEETSRWVGTGDIAFVRRVPSARRPGAAAAPAASIQPSTKPSIASQP